MLFIHNPKLRKLEAFMQEVPNLPPKYGERVYKELEEQILLLAIDDIADVGLIKTRYSL